MTDMGPDPHHPLADYLASDRGRADVAALAAEMKPEPAPIVKWVSTAIAQIVRLAVGTAIVVLVLRIMGVELAR